MANIKKLEMWRDALMEFPADRFNIATWAGETSLDPLGDTPDPSCSLCAGGLACLVPEFMAEGLHLVVKKRDSSYYYHVPEYGGHVGTRALSEFFDIPVSEVCNISAPSSYEQSRVTKNDVIQHINEVIEKCKIEAAKAAELYRAERAKVKEPEMA